MDRRKTKKQTSIIVTRRTGIACLSLILAFQLLPLNVLANDSSQQVSPTDSAAQIELTDSANQVDPADTAAQIELTVFVQQLDTAETSEQNNTEDPAETPEQNNTADPAEDFEQDNTADPTEDFEQNNTSDSAEASEQDNTEDPAEAPESLEEEVSEGVPADNDAASVESESTLDNEMEDSESEANADANAIDNGEAADNAASGDDGMEDDAVTEETKAPALVLQSEEDSLTVASEFPSRFDLRDLGRVTPVKQQSPWGSCWAFAATAAVETSILTAMDSTYAETGLDLSERHLAWYVAQPVTEDISSSQAGEGLHPYDENPNKVYDFGGKDLCAATLYAQGIGPMPESEYPYRGNEGNLAYETLLANRDAFIEAKLLEYKKSNPYTSEDKLRRRAEQYYEAYLDMYKTYDTYSEYDDWSITEADEPGSGRLRGAPYTLIDNNVFIYWVSDHYAGIDEFGKEHVAAVPQGESGTRILYQDSIDQIKSELYAGRGVSVGIKLSDDSLNEETWAQYFDGNAVTNSHAVCIVGWDDDYAASNFTNEPPGNGAWICKNSWGSQTDIIPGGLVAKDGTTRDANGADWGIVDEDGLHTGYFYLSYFDEGITAPESFRFELRENHDQENALQLDYMPAATDEWVYKDENPIWTANVFTLDQDMRIDEVATRFATGYEVPLTGFTLTFDIYRLRDGASAPDDGELLASCTREVNSSGYHRVALDAPVYSRAGDRLAVVVRQRHNYEDGSEKYFMSVQQSLDYKSNPAWRRDPVYGTPVINEGESFLKIENVTEKDDASTEGWFDLCDPFSTDLFRYLFRDEELTEHLMAWYESRYVGSPIKEVYHNDNFGIKAFGEHVALEFVKAVKATCEKAGNLAHWRDPLIDAIFADESGTKPLTLEDIRVNPLGHVWGEPTYTWSGDNSSVTAKSICQREKGHVLEETADTTKTSDDKTGKITWTAQFKNGIFTTQIRSADAEDKREETDDDKRDESDDNTDEENETRQSMDNKSNGTHQASPLTGDDADLALWCTMLAAALAGIVAALALNRNNRNTAG